MKDTIYQEIHEKIRDAKHIALISHKFPDGDTLGSMTALAEAIRINFKGKQIDMINKSGPAEKLSFLVGTERIIGRFENIRYDLCIFLDCGGIHLAGFGERHEYGDLFLINIDHHESNISYGDLNLIDRNKSSTAVLLYDLFVKMDWKINPDIATALLTGIYTDTGSFMYSNVKPRTFAISGDLVKRGGDIGKIVENFFMSNTFEFVKLFGIAIERLRISKDGVGFSYLMKEDILESGCKYEEMDGIVWRLNLLENTKYVIFIYEKEDLVKGSLRTTRDDVDLTDIVRKFGGGGHRKACGFTLDGKIAITNGRVDITLLDGSVIHVF